MNNTMTLTHKDGSKTRHQPSTDMTFGLSLNQPHEQSIRLPVPRHLGVEYVRDYTRGWVASSRPGVSAEWDEGSGSAAFDDGYMDRAATREKWHLAWCDMHDNGGAGCGRA